jgi:hypothetical protein
MIDGFLDPSVGGVGGFDMQMALQCVNLLREPLWGFLGMRIAVLDVF